MQKKPKLLSEIINTYWSFHQKSLQTHIPKACNLSQVPSPANTWMAWSHRLLTCSLKRIKKGSSPRIEINLLRWKGVPTHPSSDSNLYSKHIDTQLHHSTNPAPNSTAYTLLSNSTMEQILGPTIEIIYLLLIHAIVLCVTHSMDLGPLIRTVSLQYMARIIYLMREIF